jgi:hypothetical protein
MPAEFEITPEMIKAGEEVILAEVGGADLGGFFSASETVQRIFIAMLRAAPLAVRRRGITG